MDLTEDARAVIAGLIAPETSGIDRDHIYAPDHVWGQILALFPVELFHAWTARHRAAFDNDGIGYGPAAGSQGATRRPSGDRTLAALRSIRDRFDCPVIGATEPCEQCPHCIAAVALLADPAADETTGSDR
ncbi:MAG: hypothetical protein L0I76_23040 [Pseudonocardia sp.]|nr:hypothetical protein [Pseudonocardia sp.]